MRQSRVRLVAVLGAVCAAAGCGGGGDDKASEAAKVQEGAVVYRDALKDNDGGWFVDDGKMFFEGGRYQWRGFSGDISPASAPDKLLSQHIPEGLSVSASVAVSDGAALRVLACREVGPRDQEAQGWYELGVDGRQALIRRMAAGAPPKVLARAKLSVPNGKAARLTGQCVPDAKGGLVLALRVDGKEVARARDAKPLPATQDGVEASAAIRAYARPDTPRPANLAWTDFVVRSATVP